MFRKHCERHSMDTVTNRQVAKLRYSQLDVIPKPKDPFMHDITPNQYTRMYPDTKNQDIHKVKVKLLDENTVESVKRGENPDFFAEDTFGKPDDYSLHLVTTGYHEQASEAPKETDN